jgi:hypothetical protein
LREELNDVKSSCNETRVSELDEKIDQLVLKERTSMGGTFYTLISSYIQIEKFDCVHSQSGRFRARQAAGRRWSFQGADDGSRLGTGQTVSKKQFGKRSLPYISQNEWNASGKGFSLIVQRRIAAISVDLPAFALRGGLRERLRGAVSTTSG